MLQHRPRSTDANAAPRSPPPADEPSTSTKAKPSGSADAKKAGKAAAAAARRAAGGWMAGNLRPLPRDVAIAGLALVFLGMT